MSASLSQYRCYLLDAQKNIFLFFFISNFPMIESNMPIQVLPCKNLSNLNFRKMEFTLLIDLSFSRNKEVETVVKDKQARNNGPGN